MAYIGSSWEQALDRYLTSPPEDEVATTCDKCGGDIYIDDYAYVIDGDIHCEDCAKDWLKSMRVTATYGMRGEL